MTQFIAPGFQVGDRAFTLDGREGLITASRFNDDGGFWEHLLEGFSVFLPEFELSHDDTEPPQPPEPGEIPEVQIPPPEEAEELVGFVEREQLRGLVLAIIESRGGFGVTQTELDVAIRDAINAANLTAQANLASHVVDADARAADLQRMMTQFAELESMVTTGLSEIEKRSTELEAAAEESSGTGFFGFVGGLGGLLKNPVDWIMSRLGDHISSEVNDGLNR